MRRLHRTARGWSGVSFLLTCEPFGRAWQPIQAMMGWGETRPVPGRSAARDAAPTPRRAAACRARGSRRTRPNSLRNRHLGAISEVLLKKHPQYGKKFLTIHQTCCIIGIETAGAGRGPRL